MTSETIAVATLILTALALIPPFLEAGLEVYDRIEAWREEKKRKHTL